ncbi:MAG: cytochrome c oxidase subunit II [Proteobacteria bacterium]|nr:cytochrome c oxidase subunit II [Pseudomonadota bacterium]
MNNIADTTRHVDQTFWYITGFSLVFLFFITTVMIVFVIKYRRNIHPEPSDIRDNWKLELAWTVIPTVIALTMFYSGWSSYIGLRNVPPGAIEIDVEAQMFSWLFFYPDGKESKDLLVVPVGTPVKLNITSTDVIHSLFIPAFRVKIDAVKGMDTYVWFFPEKEGAFDLFCTEYCGESHSKMTGTVKVMAPEDYKKWLEEDD